MAGFTSVLTALPAIVQGANAAVSYRQDRAERKQAQQQLAAQQSLQERQAAANMALEREQIALNTAHTEEERRAALKRAVARQRANFGAQGVGSGGGSSQAVLLGLFDESDAERERREQMDNLRLRVMDEDLSQRRALNVLQRTQLAERGKIDRLSSYSRLAGGLADFGRGLKLPEVIVD